MQVSLIILAAGQGTRMNSDLPKVLHKVGAAPLLHHAMSAGQALDPVRTVVVVGHGAEAVAQAARAFDDSAEVVVQEEQLGTGHAVAQAAPLLANAEGEAIVLYGDTPSSAPKPCRPCWTPAPGTPSSSWASTPPTPTATAAF